MTRAKSHNKETKDNTSKLKPEDFYSYNVSWSEEDKCFIASVLEIPDLKAHGDTQVKALSEIKKATAFTIELMEQDGDEVPEPLSKRKYSGKFTLRMSKDVHRKLAIESANAGTSLNSFILNKAIS